LSLVDPDNRRPVDHDLRRRWLRALDAREAAPGSPGPDGPPNGVAVDDTGVAKLFLVSRTLRYRKTVSALFQSGDYLPWTAEGPKRDHLCAFSRSLGNRSVLAVVPRLIVGLLDGRPGSPTGAGVWGDTRLIPPGSGARARRWRQVLGDGCVVEAARGGNPGLAVAEVLGQFPVALLERIED
jgi:(1->4)-alpha-D-glucan 1-alpha-D-glucosylmutase